MRVNIPLWIDSNLVLDARRAVWLPQEKTLVVADLLLSVLSNGEDETVARLLAVIADYQPERVALVGRLLLESPEATVDPDPALQVRVKALLEALRERAALVIVGDETDLPLADFLLACDWHAEVLPAWRCGKTLLLEGSREESPRALSLLQEVFAVEGRVLMGHENPHRLLKGSEEKTPVFLLSDKVTLLPAFAVTDDGYARVYEEVGFQSGVAQRACFKQAIALSDGKLLPLRK